MKLSPPGQRQLMDARVARPAATQDGSHHQELPAVLPLSLSWEKSGIFLPYLNSAGLFAELSTLLTYSGYCWNERGKALIVFTDKPGRALR